jgi:hypothetical protein
MMALQQQLGNFVSLKDPLMPVQYKWSVWAEDLCCGWLLLLLLLTCDVRVKSESIVLYAVITVCYYEQVLPTVP